MHEVREPVALAREELVVSAIASTGAPRRCAGIMFARAKLAHVDGCFWHRCPERDASPATRWGSIS